MKQALLAHLNALTFAAGFALVGLGISQWSRPGRVRGARPDLDDHRGLAVRDASSGRKQ